jgi:Zn-dependent protease with chaperone function
VTQNYDDRSSARTGWYRFDAPSEPAMTAVSGRVSQWEGGLSWVVAGGVVVVAILVLAYIYAIPIAARIVADRMPAALTDRLGDEVLAILDRQVFSPSALSERRQRELVSAFGRLRSPEGESTRHQIQFRKSDALGANALALPSGTIVATDALVELARDDREILGVLAHEAGHVVHRHGLRNVLQESIIGLVVAWFIGDISAIAAAAPAALLQANYSRALEAEADQYAARVLKTNGIPVRYLGDILQRLDAKSGNEKTSSAFKYLSTHPATSERLEQLEGY